jgi:hypothetical protein
MLAKRHRRHKPPRLPGNDVRLVQRRPAVVFQCGATSTAVEDEIGRDIYVA